MLSEVTTMPQAAQLQGEARTQVSQLITNFNALITAQSNWREKYASVEQNLNTLLGAGADTAVTGTTGTSTTTTGTAGTSGSTTTTASKAVTVDPAIKTKLEEFKRHLTAFEAAAGAAPSPSASSEMATPPASPTSSTTSTTTTTATTPTPEPPAAPATPSQPPATTPSTTPAAPPSATAPATAPAADEDDDSDVARQIDAIEKALNDASCDPAKMAAIRAQLTQLRQAVKNPQ